jgi:histidyl-tRNA synthetase
MRDLLPPDSARWTRLTTAFGEHFGRLGFGLVQTPILEELAVFERLGEGTDVVTKEMYAFEDRDGTPIALRPESTAGVARAFIQQHPLLPWKVWYFSQHFRHERPQKGRYRQHHQLGAECFGVADADLDAEVMAALWDFYRSLGLEQIRLEVNSIGDPESRAEFAARLRQYLVAHAGDLHPDDAEKVERHPLRVLDTKHAQSQAALAGAPTLAEAMTPDATAHFDRTLDGLTAAGVPFDVNSRLVRGLDYYTHTVFEVVSDAIDAAQSTIGGGGRYDGLVEALGGAPTPAFGFGSGVERVLLACDAEGVFGAAGPALDCAVVGFGGDQRDVRDLVRDLHRDGFSAVRAYDGRSPKAQMKVADRSGARYALLLGDDERASGTVTIRDLRSDTEQRAVPRDRLSDELRKLL